MHDSGNYVVACIKAMDNSVLSKMYIEGGNGY